MAISLFPYNLSFSGLEVGFIEYRNDYFFDATAGKINSSFGYVEKGSAVLHTLHGAINVPEGSLFYVPHGVRYHSVWIGTPEIKQWCIHMLQKSYKKESSLYFPLQVIPALSTPETCNIFREIYALFSSADHIKQLQGMSLYFQFYAQALPFLETADPVQYSPFVVAAIRYIEDHYNEDFSINYLANQCHISVSALQHRFQKELLTSPVQFRNTIRIEKSALDLHNSRLSIEEVALNNGFNSSTYFYEIFKKYTGLTPAEYRRIMNT